MKAAIYNPYLDTLGGGERYTFSFARVLSDNGYQVDIEWKNKGILKELTDRFGIPNRNINIVDDVKKGDGYDLCFWVSDGSIPMLHARNNILHFQVPFCRVNGRSLINKMKMFRINKFVCNSNFTKEVIDKEYGVSSLVIFPPVDTVNIRPKRKENLILYVGRFSQLKQNKHQDVLVEAFKKLVGLGFSNWKLILAGGSEVGSSGFLLKLKEMIADYPIEIIESPSYKELLGLYGKARIFWSASGFGVDETISPELVEHFGINVVEAMSAGVVPVVYNAGGHKQTVSNGEDGFLWNTESDLVDVTKKIIENKHLLNEVSIKSKISSQKFSYEKFKSDVKKIL